MTDRDQPTWASDPTVAAWLADPATTDQNDAPTTVGSSATPDVTSYHPQQSHWPDNTDWQSKPAVQEWLTTESTTTFAASAADADPTAIVADTGYAADSTLIGGAPSLSPDLGGWHHPASADDDRLAAMVTETIGPQTPKRATRRWKRPGRRTVTMIAAIVAAAVVVIGLIAGIATIANSVSGDDPVAEPPAPSIQQSPPQAPAAALPDADCPSRTDGLVTTGRDAGGTSTGPEVIKAFEYAYYVRRSGPAAREVVAPLARVPSAEEIDTGIKTAVAVGTGHCLKITDRNDGLWGVELTVLPPGGTEPTVLHQLIQTAVIDGRTLITAITKDTTQ